MRTLSKWEIAEIKAVFLYVVKQFGEIDYYKVFKVIYFAHRKHLAKYGLPVIPDTFYALDRGPVPTELYDAVKIAIGRKKSTKSSFLQNSVVRVPEKKEYIISAIEAPDMDEISDSVKEVIDESIAEFGRKGFKDILDASHDSAFCRVYKKGSKPNPLDTVQIAIAGGASSEFAEHVREIVEFNALASV